MINYLIQILVFQALFLGVYELFLKKETFFSLNRAYLLTTPFLAALLPLLEIEILQNVVPQTGIVQLPTLFISENAAPETVSTALDLTFWETSIDFLKTNALLLIYLLGATIAFGLFLKKYNALRKLKHSGKREQYGTITLIKIPESWAAFTFFNTVFLGEDLSETETAHILAHELAHVEQKHSWDLLLFEFLRTLLWFNPLVYRFQSQLSVLHEYIADEKVSRNSEKTAYFQDLLNATFGTQKISFANQFFNESLIKKRIMMLQKPKSNRNAKLKYLLVLPLIFMMLTYVACTEDVPVNETQEMAPPPPPPPTPPKGYEDYLGFKKYMEEKGTPTDWTFEEYQKLTNIAKSGLDPEEIVEITEAEKDAGAQVPFAVIDQVPVFPDCENLSGNEAAKTCVSTKIAEFVNDNFNVKLGKQLGLSGEMRIQVMFKIDETGKVTDVKARAPRPELEQEAIRVVSMLPTMIPGEQDGKPVNVMYSLPIIFQVE